MIDDIKRKVAKIISQYGNREYKYKRNAAMYLYTPISSLDDFNTEVGYYETVGNKSTFIQYNIIYSTISALVAKIAEHSKARPFINTVKGSYKDIQVAKTAQQYFDYFIDNKNVYRTISNVFRDACIFDTGYIFLDRDNKTIERLDPWTVFYDKKELKYNNPQSVVIMKRRYPTSLIADYKGTKDEIQLIEYYSLKDKKHYTLAKGDSYYKETSWDCPELPVIQYKYDDSLIGESSNSVVDVLYGLQQKVDQLLKKIGLAIDANFGVMFAIPTMSDVKVDKLTNEVGQIVRYIPVNGSSSPVNSITEPIIDPSFQSYYVQFKSDAYDLVGISETSVTGTDKIASNMSGKALDTMESIEADRFQTQLNKLVHLYIEIANKIIELWPQDDSVLPTDKFRSNIKWKSVKAIKDKMKIQFSAASSMSKDPSKKYEMLTKLAADGYLPLNRVPQLLDMPDLELGFSFASNSQNAIQEVINDCIENDNYDIPDYIPLEDLKPEIVNSCLQLRSLGNQNKKDIEKLEKLYSIVLSIEAEIGNAATSDEADSYLNDLSNDMDYKSNMADMQTQQMTAIAQDLQNGVISQDEAQGMIDSLADMSL